MSRGLPGRPHQFACGVSLLLLGARLLAQTPALAGFPFTDETLHYTVTWPSGLGLGEAFMSASRVRGTNGKGEEWSFKLSLDAAIPGFAVADRYHAAASIDLCSVSFERELSHGARKSNEQIHFDQQTSVAHRITRGGGQSDIPISACGRDALSFLYYARRELGQGRTPPRETVLFGAPYEIRMEYTGPQTVRASDKEYSSDRVVTTVKGPASETSFEVFFARDPARTPVLVRVPLSLGRFSLELAR